MTKLVVTILGKVHFKMLSSGDYQDTPFDSLQNTQFAFHQNKYMGGKIGKRNRKGG